MGHTKTELSQVKSVKALACVSLPYSDGSYRVDTGQFYNHCGHHSALWLNALSSAHLGRHTGLKVNISHSFP